MLLVYLVDLFGIFGDVWYSDGRRHGRKAIRAISCDVIETMVKNFHEHDLTQLCRFRERSHADNKCLWAFWILLDLWALWAASRKKFGEKLNLDANRWPAALGMAQCLRHFLQLWFFGRYMQTNSKLLCLCPPHTKCHYSRRFATATARTASLGSRS